MVDSASLLNWGLQVRVLPVQLKIDYTQKCIVGFILDPDDLFKVTSPAIYEDQPRYDTKTGKQKGTERVLVKEEVSSYVLFDCENEYLWELGEEIAEKYGVDFFCDDEWLWIGYFIADTRDFGNVDLLDDEVSLDEIESKIELIKTKFDIVDKDVAIHFVTSVG